MKQEKFSPPARKRIYGSRRNRADAEKRAQRNERDVFADFSEFRLIKDSTWDETNQPQFYI